MNAFRNSIWGQIILTAVLAAGCTSEEQANPEAMGSVDVALIGETSEGDLYRLRGAFFRVSGPIFTFLDDGFDPNASSISEFVPAGVYQVELDPGWTLQRITDDGRNVTVAARLVSINPVTVVVEAGRTSRAVFQFATNGTTVTMDSGRLEIGIDIIEVDARFPDAGRRDSDVPFPVDVGLPPFAPDAGPEIPDSGPTVDSGEGTIECFIGVPDMCPIGTACFATDVDSTSCLPPGTQMRAESCEFANDCAAGLSCGTPVGLNQCFELCIPSVPDQCAEGACLAVSSTIGVCL